MLNATDNLNDFIEFLGNIGNAFTGLLQVTTAQRTGILQNALITANASVNVYDTDLSLPYWWTGTAWQTWSSGGSSIGTWLTGSTLPSSGLGDDGQWYLRISNDEFNGTLYIKSSGAWARICQFQMS